MVPLKTETSLAKSIPANGMTALALAKKIKWPHVNFLLNGSTGGWFDGRYSLLGGLPFGRFQSKGQTHRFQYLIPDQGQTTYHTGNPLEALQYWLDRFQSPKSGFGPINDLPLPTGGAFGFFSYELMHQFESIPKTKDLFHFPDVDLFFMYFYLILDHENDLVHLIYNLTPEIEMGQKTEDLYAKGYKIIEDTEKKIAQKQVAFPLQNGINHNHNGTKATSDCSSETYQKRVRRAQEYIVQGDIFQANLSHLFSAPCPVDSLFEIYGRLCQINPSPFSCYLDFGETQIASGSPERLVRIQKKGDKRIVDTRPIAGTRPRGENSAQDEALVSSLYASEKERAEHLMLVDLERNDLGKVCKYGTISVDALMALEKYSHVSHLVSSIEGELSDNVTPLQVLKAVFPGGTITGVPKVRCMEIIAELEQKARGIYTGAIGYIGFDGEMDLNIAIRTWVRKRNRMMFQVGAGIVADSDPEKEYQETLHKAAALMEALKPGKQTG